MQKRNIIFDLDGTVIDTSHRYRNTPEGHCDLDFWFANSTPEMIARDKLLPLAAIWRGYWSAGHTIIVCTARDFSPLNGVDLGAIYRKFLFDNALFHDHLLFRNMAGDDHENMGDGELKTRLIGNLAAQLGYSSIAAMNAIMFDDNVKVIAEMCRQRVDCFDAESYNRQLGNGKAMPPSLGRKLGLAA